MAGSRRVLLVSLLAVLLMGYILLAPRPLSPDLGISRAWATDVSGTPAQLDGAAGSGDVGTEAEASRMAFRLGRNFGYVERESGNLLHHEPVLYDVTYNEEHYINFSAVSQTVVVRDWRGGIIAGIQGIGYPHLRRQRLFVLHPQGIAVSEWTLSGEQRWRQSLPAVITSLAASENRAVLGLSDGSIRFLSEDGSTFDSYVDPAARLPVALGVAATEGGAQVAAVTGIDPQRLIIFEEGESQFVPRRQTTLSSEFRRPLFISYLFEDEVLAFEGTDGLNLYEVSNGSVTQVAHRGRLAAVAVDETLESVGVLGAEPAPQEEPQPYHAVIQLYPNRPLAAFDFTAESASLMLDSGWILIGIDSTLLGAEVVRL